MGVCWEGSDWGLGQLASWAVYGSVHGWCMAISSAHCTQPYCQCTENENYKAAALPSEPSPLILNKQLHHCREWQNFRLKVRLTLGRLKWSSKRPLRRNVMTAIPNIMSGWVSVSVLVCRPKRKKMQKIGFEQNGMLHHSLDTLEWG